MFLMKKNNNNHYLQSLILINPNGYCKVKGSPRSTPEKPQQLLHTANFY